MEEKHLSISITFNKKIVRFSKLLSAKPLELSSAVRDLGQRYLDLQKSYRQLSTEIMLKDAKQIPMYDAILYTALLADYEAMRVFCNHCIKKGISTVMVIAEK